MTSPYLKVNSLDKLTREISLWLIILMESIRDFLCPLDSTFMVDGVTQ